MKAIAFTNSKIIHLTKKFVSQYSYVIDTTFKTNKCHLLLLACISIDNTDKKNFLLVYIVNESANVFRFVNNVLAELIFYNISSPTVCIRNFTTNLQNTVFHFNKQEMTAAAETKWNAKLC